MSNFKTFNPLQNGDPRPGPQFFSASTTETIGDVIATGYMDDREKEIQAGDFVLLKAEEGEATEQTRLMRISYDGTNWNLLNVFTPEIYEVNEAGGAASFSLSITGLTANDSVIVNVKSATNPASLETATAATDAVDVVMSADPGASVFEVWVARPL